MVMKHVIIGTAGHIDHGKTQLTKALTGIDTDRLPEEKQREMSIDLGFAPLKLEDGLMASIVDVPGHERFIRNMVAGVGGIDIVLFTIAADDGVMPQTNEHFQIIKLLDLKHGIIAVTKADLVDDDMLEMVKEEIELLVESSFLEGASIIPVSVVDGRGLDSLKQEIITLGKHITRRDPEGLLVMPIDRVFSLPGFGTVITGTLVSGTVSTGDRLELLPRAQRVRIRGIQVHKQQVDQAVAGQRTALNVADASKHEISRGDVLSQPGVLEATRAVDAKLELLSVAKRPLKYWTRVRFHVGTTEVMARVKPFVTDVIKPGETAFLQLKLEKPVAALRGDRFIIRSYSPQATIGGGTILDVYPGRYRRKDEKRLKRLEVMAGGNNEETVLACLQRGYEAASLLAKKLQFTREEFDTIVHNLESEHRARRLGQYLFSETVFGELKTKLVHTLTAAHKKAPLRSWIRRDKIFKKLNLDREIFNLLASQIEVIETRNDLVKLAEWKPQFSTDQLQKRSDIEMKFQEARFNPPAVQEDDIFKTLVDDRVLIKISDGLFFHHQTIEDAKKSIRDHIQENGAATAAEIKNLLQTTRKYAIPLLEYFDRIQFTERRENTRILFSGGG